jgi:hypothetical protein
MMVRNTTTAPGELVLGIHVGLPLHLLLLEQVETHLDARIAEGVTAIRQKDGHPIVFIVDLTAEGAFNLF